MSSNAITCPKLVSELQSIQQQYIRLPWYTRFWFWIWSNTLATALFKLTPDSSQSVFDLIDAYQNAFFFRLAFGILAFFENTLLFNLVKKDNALQELTHPHIDEVLAISAQHPQLDQSLLMKLSKKHLKFLLKQQSHPPERFEKLLTLSDTQLDLLNKIDFMPTDKALSTLLAVFKHPAFQSENIEKVLFESPEKMEQLAGLFDHLNFEITPHQTLTLIKRDQQILAALLELSQLRKLSPSHLDALFTVSLDTIKLLIKVASQLKHMSDDELTSLLNSPQQQWLLQHLSALNIPMDFPLVLNLTAADSETYLKILTSLRSLTLNETFLIRLAREPAFYSLISLLTTHPDIKLSNDVIKKLTACQSIYILSGLVKRVITKTSHLIPLLLLPDELIIAIEKLEQEGVINLPSLLQSPFLDKRIELITYLREHTKLSRAMYESISICKHPQAIQKLLMTLIPRSVLLGNDLEKTLKALLEHKDIENMQAIIDMCCDCLTEEDLKIALSTLCRESGLLMVSQIFTELFLNQSFMPKSKHNLKLFFALLSLEPNEVTTFHTLLNRCANLSLPLWQQLHHTNLKVLIEIYLTIEPEKPTQFMQIALSKPGVTHLYPYVKEYLRGNTYQQLSALSEPSLQLLHKMIPLYLPVLSYTVIQALVKYSVQMSPLPLQPEKAECFKGILTLLKEKEMLNAGTEDNLVKLLNHPHLPELYRTLQALFNFDTPSRLLIHTLIDADFKPSGSSLSLDVALPKLMLMKMSIADITDFAQHPGLLELKHMGTLRNATDKSAQLKTLIKSLDAEPSQRRLVSF